MSRQGPRRTASGLHALWAALALTLCLLAAGMGPAGAQTASRPLESYLRVEWTVESAKSGRQRITGYLYNDRDVWAANVRLLVEALDASGQVVGSTLVPVFGQVPPRNRSYFDAALSLEGSSYRVTVRVVDWRGYGAGG